MKALGRLNKYIWRYKGLLLFGIFCVLVSNLFGIYPPQVVRSAIDLVGDLVKINALHEGFEAKASVVSLISGSLIIFSVLTISLALLRGVFLFLMRQTLIVMSRRVEFDLRNDMYAHYQDLSLSFYRKNRTGDLMARITEDVGRVRMYLGPGIMYTINTVSLMVIVVATMMTVNPQLTLFTILPLPLLSVLIYYVESKVLKRSDKIQEQMSRLTAFTQEIYSGIRVTKAYTREKDFGKKFASESQEYHQRSMQLIRLNAYFFPAVMILVGLSTALLVWVGAEKVIGGSLTVGNIAEFIIYVNMLTFPIISIGWVTSLTQRAAASQKRINEFLDEKSEIVFPENDFQITQARIEFDKVSLSYPATGFEALHDVSFTLLPGQKLGIIGPTGSGKSSLCNLIPRLFDATSGTIRIDGRDIRDYSKTNLRNEIGYAPQDVFLFSESIFDNVAFGLPGATQEQVALATQRSGVYENIMGFAEGFQTVIGERGVTLSGGQKQRVALARAWIRDPKLLILDDSMSAVDTKTEEMILGHLRQARIDRPEMAVIMVSHRVSTIQDADLIIVIDGGRILEQGNHAALLAQEGYYSVIHNKQLIEKELSVGNG
ncbi:MAG: ABC transporter ATP-binding protein [Bacteroidetes bacterium]|nr:ABC transporter ATP-binding protein [Bacteroidota bacterium]